METIVGSRQRWFGKEFNPKKADIKMLELEYQILRIMEDNDHKQTRRELDIDNDRINAIYIDYDPAKVSIQYHSPARYGVSRDFCSETPRIEARVELTGDANPGLYNALRKCMDNFSH